MEITNEEYWVRYEEKDRDRKPKYAAQIRDIQGKLERGTRVIKENHRVKGLNPDAHARELPLSEGQMNRLRWNLNVLIFRLTEGYGGALGLALPEHLNRRNPQGEYWPSWDYNRPKS